MDKKFNLVNIADSGDPLETMKALRHIVAEAIIKSESGRDIAALTRQMQILIQSISEIEAEREEKNDEVMTVLEEVRSRHPQVRPDKIGDHF